MATSSDCEISYPASCSICCRHLNNPKTLNCGHSFCLNPCLQERVKVQQVICTICKKESPLPEAGRLEDLPTNVNLQSEMQSEDSSTRLSQCQIPPTDRKIEKPEVCSIHDKVQEYFCQTCHCELCPECAEDIHDSNHDVMTVAETSEKAMTELCGIQKELCQVKEELQKKFTAIAEAIAKCDFEASEIKAAISEEASSTIKLLKQNVNQLHVEVDAAAMIARQRIRKVDITGKEVSLYLDYVTGMMESLLNDFKINDFRRMEVMNGLVEKKNKLQSETERLRKEPVCDDLGVSFIPCETTQMDIGELNKKCKNELPKHGKERKVTAVNLRHDVKFNVSEHDYLGFAWFSVDVFACISRSIFSTKKLECMLESYREVQSMPEIELNSVPKRLYTFPPALGNNQRNILINGPKEVYKVTFNLSDNTTTVQERIVNDSISYDIAAISWDENRTGFYVFLNDGLTLLRSNFSTSETPDKLWNITLDQHIKCDGSRQFHVSQLGSMAIADRETVYFFKDIQSHFTENVKGPKTSFDSSPVSVTTLTGGQTWVVGWRTSTRRSMQKLVLCQYSQDFKFMREIFKYESESIMSVAFFDDIHFAVETQVSSKNQTPHAQKPTHTPLQISFSNENMTTKDAVYGGTVDDSATLHLSLFYLKEID